MRRRIARRDRGPGDAVDRLVSYGPAHPRPAVREVELDLVAMLAAAPSGIRTAQLAVELAECTRIDEPRARRLLARALAAGSVRLIAGGRRVAAVDRAPVPASH